MKLYVKFLLYLFAMSLQDGSMNVKPQNSQDKILYQIKRLGPQSAALLSKQLDMTTMGIRQHLDQLSAEGLVQATEPRGQARGRPVRHWQLTEKGNRRFPDAHAQVTAELIAGVRDLLGADSLDQIIRHRGEQALAHYRQVLVNEATLQTKVIALARARTEEGYMADVQLLSAEEMLLIENHCPICIAAQSCQGFCRTELETFQQLFGDGVKVEREDYLLAGGRRCSYRISKVSA